MSIKYSHGEKLIPGSIYFPVPSLRRFFLSTTHTTYNYGGPHWHAREHAAGGGGRPGKLGRQGRPEHRHRPHRGRELQSVCQGMNSCTNWNRVWSCKPFGTWNRIQILSFIFRAHGQFLLQFIATWWCCFSMWLKENFPIVLEKYYFGKRKTIFPLWMLKLMPRLFQIFPDV